MQITTLIELLMRHAVKLESIPAAGGDSSSQKNIQVHLSALNGITAWALLFRPVSDSGAPFCWLLVVLRRNSKVSIDINRKYLACEWPSSAMTSSACKCS